MPINKYSKKCYKRLLSKMLVFSMVFIMKKLTRLPTMNTLRLTL